MAVGVGPGMTAALAALAATPALTVAPAGTVTDADTPAAGVLAFAGAACGCALAVHEGASEKMATQTASIALRG